MKSPEKLEDVFPTEHFVPFFPTEWMLVTVPLEKKGTRDHSFRGGGGGVTFLQQSWHEKILETRNSSSALKKPEKNETKHDGRKSIVPYAHCSLPQVVLE